MKKRKFLGKTEKKNKVAVQFQNGIGNFVMMTPAIRALAQHFHADIDVILDRSWTDSRRKGLEEFCKIWPLVNEVREFQNGFDKKDYVHLFYAQHGETSESHSYFKENAEHGAEHVNWRAGKQHEIDYYMDAVYETGYRGPVPDQHYTTRVPHNFRVETNDIKMFRVGFCNGFFAGSKWGWERKGWPYFPELANLLQRYFKGRMKIYLFGKGERELAWAKTIKGDRIESYVGKMELPTSTSFIRYMDVFITTDTGLMHLADAINTPMIALFGSTLVSKNGPYNKEHRIVRSALPCAPCQQSPNFSICKEWKCMEQMTPDIVMAEVRRYVYDLIGRGMLQDHKTKEGELKPCLL